MVQECSLKAECDHDGSIYKKSRITYSNHVSKKIMNTDAIFFWKYSKFETLPRLC